MSTEDPKRWTYYCPHCGYAVVRDGALWKCDNPEMITLSTGQQIRCSYRGQWPNRKEVLEMKSD